MIDPIDPNEMSRSYSNPSKSNSHMTYACFCASLLLSLGSHAILPFPIPSANTEQQSAAYTHFFCAPNLRLSPPWEFSIKVAGGTPLPEIAHPLFPLDFLCIIKRNREGAIKKGRNKPPRANLSLSHPPSFDQTALFATLQSTGC